MLHGIDSIFENLPKTLKPNEVVSLFGCKLKTIYDWHYRPKKRKIPVPENLFVKFNGRLTIQTEILKQWITSQNPSLA